MRIHDKLLRVPYPVMKLGTYATLKETLLNALEKFEDRNPGNYRPLPLAHLTGLEATLFARLFKDWPKSTPKPDSLFACAVLKRHRPAKMILTACTKKYTLGAKHWNAGKCNQREELYFPRLASHMSNTPWLFGSIVTKAIPIPELARE